MKIDLHVHTIKTKLDSSNRNIPSIEEFLNILNKSSVGIVAITNHNIFDDEQFNNIIEKNENDILFLPGIELSIRINKEIKHLNLIFDPKYKNDLIEFIKENKINDREFKAIEIEKVLEEFGNSDKCIFLLDYKNNRKFSEDEINKYFKNEKFSSVFLLDINNEKSFDFFLYWNENSLIGSDNHDWETYFEKSHKLVEYNGLISNFKDLYDIFSDKTTYLFFKQHNLIENFEIKLYDKKRKKIISYIPNIKLIKQGVNVIFGPKASGKTSLLEELYNELKVDESKKIILNTGEEADKNIILSKISNESIDSFKQEKTKINEKFDDILSFNEKLNNRSTMKDFHYFITNKKIGKNKLINLKIEQYQDHLYKSNIKKILKNYNEIISEYKAINKECFFDDHINSIKELIKKLKEKYIELNFLNWKVKIRNKTIETIKEITKVHKQEYSKVWTFGLKEKFTKRKQLKEKIDSLNGYINNLKKEKVLKSINVPIENSEKLRKWNIIAELKFGWKDGEKNKFNKNTADYRNNIGKLLKIKNFEPVEKLIQDLNANKSDDLFKIDYYFKCEEDENKEPSSGELSFIRLMNELEKEGMEYFFLDEPETHLNNNFISNQILDKIIELSKNKKTFIISTLNSVIGINTHPMNYILRETINIEYNGVICNETWYGNISEGFLISCYNQNNKIPINAKILEYFEGKENLYKYRKKVYGVE